MQIREASLSDIDQVTDVLITSFPQDKEWWDFRYPFRDEYPEDHRQYLKLLVQTWIAPENEDYVVTVAEVPDAARPEELRIGAFAAWNISYRGRRRHGPGYVEHDPGRVVYDAGGSTRRDINPLQTAEFAAGIEKASAALKNAYGDNQLLLQALGTRPDFQRRGLGSALVQWGLEQAINHGVTATLVASPMGRLLYRSLGFMDIGEEVVCSSLTVSARALLYPMAYDGSKHEQ